jgi:hypothetical protein
LLRAIGDSWIEKGISTREQAKQFKIAQNSKNVSGRSSNNSYNSRTKKEQIEIYKEPEHLETPSDEEWQKSLERAQRIRDEKLNNKPA